VPVVAIDGPAGSGKSTVAQAVARHIGLERLDTGAMYRAVALAALRQGVDPADAATLAALARHLSLDVAERVAVDGVDVTEAIRRPDVDAIVSAVAAHPEVRAEMVQRQRAWVEARGGGVVEGRDIGSVVFPEADLKVYLTASGDERARRRSVESSAQDPESVAADLAHRDHVDSTRSASPLRVADGAVVIDTTGRSVDSVVEEVLARL
jgi:cytidylate kinase